MEDLIDYAPKVKIEIIVNDEMGDQIAEIIRLIAHTGNKGHGKIFIHDVRNVIRIMTWESGEAAV